MSALSEALAATLKDLTQHEDRLLAPITRAMLIDPKFKGFDVTVEPWTPRPYDGWFHPSTHSTWTERQLYHYLNDPDQIEQEQMSLTSVLAITQGKFFHDFLQKLWLSNGVLTTPEVPLVDKKHNRRGHMDGDLSTGEGLEIKTINDFQITKIVDAESLRERKPGYYAQTQDYLDMSGRLAMRYFMITTSYPYEIQEFVVPRDGEFIDTQRQRYLAALTHYRKGTQPDFCCAPLSKQAKACPVAGACEIGRIR